MASAEPPEIALSAAWHAGALPVPFATIDGCPLQVIHRGAWSHGLGPDFRDVLILFGDRELRSGAVEVHKRTTGWTEHGHHLDTAYNAVILHVVGCHDGNETRRADGALVPIAELGAAAAEQVYPFASWDWDRVGGSACAEELTREQPRLVCDVLCRLGDTRLAARSARLESRLFAEPPGEVLWSELLDGLGYSANRGPMHRLAQLVRIASLEAVLQAVRVADRLDTARGVLLGAGGFLPLSPSEAHLGRLSKEDVDAIETSWREHGAPWRDGRLPADEWKRARVRPANHPVPRLLAAAALVTHATGVAGLFATVTGLVLEPDDLINRLRALTATGATPGIGADRALDIAASSIVPLALAHAEQTADSALAEAAAAQWETLPAPAPNAVTRRAQQQVAGVARLGKIGARGAQGLIHLDTTLCQPRRCFECPIAAAVLAPEPRVTTCVIPNSPVS
jgi:hypothetical protein